MKCTQSSTTHERHKDYGLLTLSGMSDNEATVRVWAIAVGQARLDGGDPTPKDESGDVDAGCTVPPPPGTSAAAAAPTAAVARASIARRSASKSSAAERGGAEFRRTGSSIASVPLLLPVPLCCSASVA